MGNCVSDPSKPTSGGQKLGSGPASSSQPPISPRRTAPPAVPPRTLGGTGGGSGGVTALGAEIGEGDGDARDRALRAAEERAKAASAKGVSGSNPRAGQLSAKLAAERKVSPTSPKQGDERMMDRGDWN